MNDCTYENDYFAWSLQQAKYIREGKFEKLDIINLQDEIESMGKSEIRALESHLHNALMHMLKQKYQNSRDGKSWQSSIKEAKVRVKKVLRDNPSLKYRFSEIFKDSYETAKIAAAGETGLDENTFPENCPWNIQEILK